MSLRLARGQRVGERYRLERELGRGGGSVTWEAVDERLDRSVAVRIFDSGVATDVLMKRAGRAASLTHPRVVRVFDSGQEGGRFFTVSELLPASLRTVRLPLAHDHAISTAIDIAEALQYAHERGVPHGHIHEGNVLLSESGAKVGDFGLASTEAAGDKAGDLQGFGLLLRRAAGIQPEAAPTGLARVIDGLSNGAYDDATSALDELRTLRPAPVQRVARPPRRGWLLIVVALLIALAAFGATRLGERQPQTRLAPGGRIEGTPLVMAGADDFDPLGDGAEGSSTVPKINDGDPTTFWSTERYRSSPDFNGLKPGVGVILDPGREIEVDKAQILFRARGCSFELRYAADRSLPISQWSVAATVTDSEQPSAAIVFEARSARYWLLWITRLTTRDPGGGGPFTCEVAEADLFAP